MFGICRAISDSSRLHYTWSPSKTQRLEDRLQESFLQTALQDHGKTVTRLTTDLPDGRSISSFRIAGVSYGPSEDGTQAAPLVFIHGFGGGKSTWCPLLLHAIPDIPNRDIYCLDLPGMGASTACVHSAQRVFRSARKEATDGGSDLALHFYSSAIEAWRVQIGLEKMDLVGHSLGALVSLHLATSTAAASIDKLILLCPAGLKAAPVAPSSSGPKLGGKEAEKPFLRALNKFLGFLWSTWGLTPLSVARLSGPMMPLLIHTFLRKYAHWQLGDAATSDLFHTYFYALVRNRSSAEVFMRYAVGPRGDSAAMSKDMMSTLDQHVDVSCVRGEYDWVPPYDGLLVADQPVRIIQLPGLGHSPHFEDPKRVWAALRSLLTTSC